MDTTLRRRESPQFTVVAYTLFAVAATLFAVARQLHDPLGVAAVPYIGWIGDFLYVFTLWFAFSACFSAEPKLLTPLISFQKLFVAVGLFDLGMGVYLMFMASNFNNPYLTYSPFRPLFTICVPALWWYVLSRHKRHLESTIFNDTEATNRPMHPDGSPAS